MLAAHGVDVRVDSADGFTPTPAEEGATVAELVLDDTTEPHFVIIEQEGS